MHQLATFVFVVVLSLLTGCQPKTASDIPATSETPAPAANESKVVEAHECKLRLGYEAWEPYQYTALDQKAAGLDIEIIAAVSKNMGCQLVTSQGTWVDLVAQLREGSIDILAGASKTPAREQFAFFSAPYRQEQFQLFVLTAKSASMPESSLSDFIAKGYKVGIISEYVYGDELSALSQDLNKKEQFVEASLGELNIARLMDGDIEGMLEDSFVARSMLRRKGLSDQIGPQGITLQSNDVYVMFSKSAVPEATVMKFNQSLQNIRNNGAYMLIIEKYQQ